MLNKKALAGTAGAPKEYVEDVFSTFIYNGNATSRSIVNGIDLAGKGGMVWIKERAATSSHFIFDTARTEGRYISSNSTAASQTDTNTLSSFDSTGFSLGTDSNTRGTNRNTQPTVSWTFREAPKFFDVVTYTGNGTTKNISHNLGSVPGMIIVKRTDGVPNWCVYHRSRGAGFTGFLNLTDAFAESLEFGWGNNVNTVDPTTTSFTVGSNVTVNANNGTYVAYLFAHDAGGFGDAGTDNIISCGSYTGTGATGNNITLNYEPQFLMVKRTDSTGDWVMVDNLRRFDLTNTSALCANSSAVENGVQGNNSEFTATATGFQCRSSTSATNASGGTYIYIAIRRPMKVPTSGSQVFTPIVYTGTNADNRLIDTGIFTDMVMLKERNDTVAGMVVGDRLRGQPYLLTGSTAAEVNDADSFDAQFFDTAELGSAWTSNTGIYIGNDATSKVNIDTTSNNHIALAFKRARKFFDIVCYTGTGANRTVTHNLGVAPELMIVKRRDSTSNWTVFNQASGNTGYLNLNTNESLFTGNTDRWNSTSPTSSVFSLGTNTNVNASSGTYVAYLFASVDGISKVGSYSGNGSNQTINCGFSAGARLVLIKRTDSTGDWYVFDTARGIVSGNDPFILLNSASAEVTTRDAIDPDNSGFIVNNDATNFPINVNNATYIYLAIA